MVGAAGSGPRSETRRGGAREVKLLEAGGSGPRAGQVHRPGGEGVGKVKLLETGGSGPGSETRRRGGQVPIG